jgi:AcrR family transcriptional regulator
MQIVKEEIRTRLIESAIAEFYARGYEKASLRNIARAANTSVSNLYNYFPNKEQLFAAIIGPVYAQLQHIIAEIDQKSTGQRLQAEDIPAFTQSIMETFLEMTGQERLLLVILVEKSQGTQYQKARIEITLLIKAHLLAALSHIGNQDRRPPNRDYIMGIIAAHYVDGLFNILKDFRSLPWAKENLQILLTYHLNGIKALIRTSPNQE